jgi:hypothetical protein
MPSDFHFDDNDFVSQNASDDTPQVFIAPAGCACVTYHVTRQVSEGLSPLDLTKPRAAITRQAQRHRLAAPLAFDQGAPSEAQLLIPK